MPQLWRCCPSIIPGWGIVTQKQIALQNARSEWVLCLDADEVVSEALAEEIGTVDRRALPRMWLDSPYPGSLIISDAGAATGGWYPDRKIRLVRKGRGVGVGVDPHDKTPEVDGRKLSASHTLFCILSTAISPTNWSPLIVFQILRQNSKGRVSGAYVPGRPWTYFGKVCRMLLVEIGVPGWMGWINNSDELGLVCLFENMPKPGK